jgi:hypothetical protein
MFYHIKKFIIMINTNIDNFFKYKKIFIIFLCTLLHKLCMNIGDIFIIHLCIFNYLNYIGQY